MVQSVRHGCGFGGGKVILFGEHVVVYGIPAIAAGLDCGARAYVEEHTHHELTLHVPEQSEPFVHLDPISIHKDERLGHAWALIRRIFGLDTQPLRVRLDVDLPLGAGLGSSAAISVALAHALCALVDGAPASPDDTRITEAVAASEGAFHGRASGIDQAAAQFGGLFRFECGASTQMTPIHTASISCIICQAQAGASTSLMVERVAALRQRRRPHVEALECIVAKLVLDAQEAIRQRDMRRLGDLMNLNHGVLVSLGVSTAALDRACHMARDAGALGAKLTGAGGGGCVLILAEPDTTAQIIDCLRTSHMNAFDVSLGVRRGYDQGYLGS